MSGRAQLPPSCRTAPKAKEFSTRSSKAVTESGRAAGLRRRGRDSNPRSGFPNTAFPVLHNRPLCHLSEAASYRVLLESSPWARRRTRQSLTVFLGDRERISRADRGCRFGRTATLLIRVRRLPLRSFGLARFDDRHRPNPRLQFSAAGIQRPPFRFKGMFRSVDSVRAQFLCKRVQIGLSTGKLSFELLPCLRHRNHL